MAAEQVVVVRRLLDAHLPPLLARGSRVTLDLGALTDADLATVDALARLHVAAGRAGCALRLRNVPPALAELLELAGLSGAVT